MAAKKASAEPDRFGEGEDEAADSDDISGGTRLADAAGGFGAGLAANSVEGGDSEDSDVPDLPDVTAAGDDDNDGGVEHQLVDLADARDPSQKDVDQESDESGDDDASSALDDLDLDL